MPKNKLLFFLSLATLIAYGSSFKYGFSQDDWFHLSISQATTFTEFLNFFNPAQVSWIFFRPLSTQVPYWLASSLFPLSSAPYFLHSLMLCLHLANAYLATRIARPFLSDSLAFTLGIIYAIAPLHFLSLFYIGAIQQLISTLFSLIAIHYFLISKARSQWILGILTLSALLSKELALRLPLILLVLSYLKDHRIWPTIKRVIGPLVVTVLYFALRYFVGTHSASEYEVVLGIGTSLATLMWYGLFLLGFPESILGYGLARGRVDFFSFFTQSGPLAWLIAGGSLLILVLAVSRLLTLIKSRAWSSLVILPALSVLSILPIIFLPTHRYPHYLDLALLGMGIWLLQGVTKITHLVKIGLTLVCLSMLTSIAVESHTHWTIKRAVVSKQIISQLSQPGACSQPEGVVFTGTSLELRELGYALSLEHAPRIICQNPTLPVYYKQQP